MARKTLTDKGVAALKPRAQRYALAPGRSDGVPDPDWAMRVVNYLEEQKIDRLIAEATQHQLLKAGNVGGELLNWIAMMGAIGDRKPDYVAPQMQNGHAYGVWRWD
jgi:hypothetical protein